MLLISGPKHLLMLEIIFFLGFALYSDIKPLTARFKAESRAIHYDVHASSLHLKGNKL